MKLHYIFKYEVCFLPLDISSDWEKSKVLKIESINIVDK